MSTRRPMMVLIPLLAGSLAGCTAHRAPMVAEVAPPADALPGPSLPPGATPGMLVPEALADGSFPTPNRGLTGAAAIWHLRAGLNVAALSCPGAEGEAIRAGYNRWLTRDKAPLARVAKAYAATYPGGAGTGSYDDAMTRLYNFFSQTPVRPGLCAAAAGVAAELAGLDAAAMPDFAQSRLASLDQPFADFYRAYDAWRGGNRPRTVIAAAAVAQPAPPGSAPAPAASPRRATLTLDLSSLPTDSVVTAAR